MTRATVLVEACVTTWQEAQAAVAAGAGRLELCRELDTGGLTPSPELLARVQSSVPVPVFAMVRPVAGSFQAGPAQAERMVRDAAACVDAGADGVVAGVLDAAGEVDTGVVGELLDAVRGRPLTFHRAFDQVPDPGRTLERLVDLGVARILTSGGAETAWAGRGRLRELVRAAAGRLVVVAGGGVRGGHVTRLVHETGVVEVHARASAIAAVVQALTASAPADAPTRAREVP